MKIIFVLIFGMAVAQANGTLEAPKDTNGVPLWAPPSNDPSEAGMSPSQRDFQNRIDYSRSINQKESRDQLGVFEKGRIEKGIQFDVTFKVICGDPNSFTGAVPARGQKIYWSVLGKSGLSVVNERGLLQFSFVAGPSAESHDWKEEIHLYFDEAHKQVLPTKDVMSAATEFCSPKVK